MIKCDSWLIKIMEMSSLIISKLSRLKRSFIYLFHLRSISSHLFDGGLHSFDLCPRRALSAPSERDGCERDIDGGGRGGKRGPENHTGLHHDRAGRIIPGKVIHLCY